MGKGLMDQARAKLQGWIEATKPEERVASVASLSAAVGGLSTAATVTVLKEAIDDGWIFSTRGPEGGYWRTAKKATPGLAETLDELELQLRSALGSVQTLRTIVS